MSMDNPDILEDLRQGGRVESTGHFTLDAAKAREKLKRFQLQDPHHYVLQVVRSAVASGARRVDLRVDADDCWIEHDGNPPMPTELQGLFNHLLRTAKTPEERSLRALATGVNSALALKPAWIDLQTWDGRNGWALRIDAEGERVHPIQPSPERSAGVWLHVRRQHSWQVLGRFLRGIVTMHPEARAMHDHGLWCPAKVYVNGRRLRGGLLPGQPELQREIRAEDYRARVGLLRQPLADSVLVVVLDGVVLDTRTLDLGPLAVQAVVWDPDITCNVSLSGVAEDGAWRAFLVDLRKRLRSLLVEFCGQTRENPGLLPHLLAAMRKQKLRANQNWRRWRELKQALLDVPAFPVVQGPPTTLRVLLEEAERGGCIPGAAKTSKTARQTSPRLVPLMGGEAGEVLREVFAGFVGGGEGVSAAEEDALLEDAPTAAPPSQAPARPTASPAPRRRPRVSPPVSETEVSSPTLSSARKMPPARNGAEDLETEESLLRILRQELQGLQGPANPELRQAFLDSLHLQTLGPQKLWNISPGGREAAFSRDHPLVHRLLDLLSHQQSPDPWLQILMCTLHTALSQATPGLRGPRERAFHGRLLERLLAEPEEGLSPKDELFADLLDKVVLPPDPRHSEATGA
jgi:hypothetical protein